MSLEKKIILSEDDDDDQLFFKEALAGASVSWSLEIVTHGQALMDRLYGGPAPDIIFLDINMPVKNGFECLMEIRHDPVLRNIPVIILSTAIGQRTIDFTHELGANMYICKPVSLPRFSELIDMALCHEWTLKSPPTKDFNYY